MLPTGLLWLSACGHEKAPAGFPAGASVVSTQHRQSITSSIHRTLRSCSSAVARSGQPRLMASSMARSRRPTRRPTMTARSPALMWRALASMSCRASLRFRYTSESRRARMEVMEACMGFPFGSGIRLDAYRGSCQSNSLESRGC
nr:MAG TPA: hypothetical protein [Caudoviricetes sp.]